MASLNAPNDETIIKMIEEGVRRGYERGKSDGSIEGMERAALVAKSVIPRHTECGNKIAAAIQAAAKEIK